MNVIKDFKNDLLKRRELKVVLTAKSNPGFTNASKFISDEFKVKEDVLAIKNVKSKFGRDTFLIDAFIYHSANDKERIEPKPKIKVKKEGAA